MVNHYLDIIDDTIASQINATIDDIIKSSKRHYVPISRDTAIVYLSQWLLSNGGKPRMIKPNINDFLKNGVESVIESAAEEGITLSRSDAIEILIGSLEDSKKDIEQLVKLLKEAKNCE